MGAIGTRWPVPMQSVGPDGAPHKTYLHYFDFAFCGDPARASGTAILIAQARSGNEPYIEKPTGSKPTDW
jgi:hypothetical protein